MVTELELDDGWWVKDAMSPRSEWLLDRMWTVVVMVMAMVETQTLLMDAFTTYRSEV